MSGLFPAPYLFFLYKKKITKQSPSANVWSVFLIFGAKMALKWSHGITQFGPFPERQSGPGNSRLNREKKVLLACSGTAPLTLQARWLI